MARPADEELYKKAKQEVDMSYKKPSAYRSMAYTRTYLKAFREKYGEKKKPYAGEKPGNLEKWRDENWVDIKSFVADPKNPTACGNEPIKKGEYPLCMPIKKAARYSKEELVLLLDRKAELGKRRLVKDAYLRDLLEPEDTPPERVYKERYITDKKLKMPEPLSKARAEKILKAPPIAKEAGIKIPKEAPAPRQPKAEPVPRETKPTGRPKKSEEDRRASVIAYEEKRKAARAEAAAIRAEAKRQLQANKPAKVPRVRALRESEAKPKAEAKPQFEVKRITEPITIDFN
jgi:hypothetical protein